MQTQFRPAVVFIFVLVAALQFASTGSWAAQPVDFAGHWEGAIEAPGQKIDLNIDVRKQADRWEGDVTIPVQHATDLPLSDVKMTSDGVSFAIPNVPGDPVFKGKFEQEGQKITGTLTQGGADIPFTLERSSAEMMAKKALEGFDDFLTKAIEDWKTPGLAVGIVVKGKVVYAKGFGKRDVEKDLPVTSNTLFAIGSSTKAFTTFAMGTLVDEAKLDWDKPVVGYLPNFKLRDEYATLHVSPRDLVTHRTGLPRHDLAWYNNHRITRKDIVDRLRYFEPNKELRQTFQYNNMMFMVAGHLVEQITGQKWEDAIRARVFEPLGMKNSNFSVTDSQKSADFAQPYKEEKDKILKIPFRNIDEVGPAGAINSSVADMVNWLIVHINEGKFGDREILKSATIREMHTPQIAMSSLPEEPEVSPVSYALGWFADSYRGHYRVHHGGSIDGFLAEVVFYPYDDIGIVAFANKSGSSLPGLAVRHASDRLLDLKFRDWSGEALTRHNANKAAGEKAEERKGELRTSGTLPSHPLADYAGEYEHPGYGVLAIKLDGDHLTMTFNDIVTSLQHWHYETFDGLENKADPTFKDGKFTFRTNEQGEIVSISSAFEPFVDDIVFKRKPDTRLTDPEYLKQFTGEYVLPDGKPLAVTLTGNVLTVAPPGQKGFQLAPKKNDEFSIKDVPIVSVQFAKDKEGKAVIRIKDPGSVQEFKKK